ncbi:MAG: endonuclease/exonuclease/phosphatase family protein [Myxococcaceae bacterium]
MGDRFAWAGLLLFVACGPSVRNQGTPEGRWKEQDMKGEQPLGQTAQMPEAGKLGFSVLVANVGNSDIFNCAGVNLYKLCQVASEKAVAARVEVLRPDVVLFSEAFAPWLCDKVGAVDEKHVCHPSNTQAEPEQVRRILGSNYTISCDANSGFECIAIRREFGRMKGCEDGAFCRGLSRTAPVIDDCDIRLGIDQVDTRHASVSGVTLEVDGKTFDALVAHPPASTAPEAAQCRRRFLPYVMEPVGSDGSVRERPAAILGGDFNLDPYRNAPTAVDVVYWNQSVRLSLEGEGGPWVSNSGPIEHDPPYWTSPLSRSTLDHVVTQGLVGRCQTLGAAQGRPPLDGASGAELERLDHLAQWCLLELK